MDITFYKKTILLLTKYVIYKIIASKYNIYYKDNDNITEAISITKANFVDVSSGVEDSLGIKNNDLITKFVYNARNAD